MASSPPDSLADFLELVDAKFFYSLSSVDIWLLRVMIGISVVIVLVYGLGTLRTKKCSLWLVRVDSEGYWHPNVHTVFPTLFSAHGFVLGTSFFLACRDSYSPVSPDKFILLEVSLLILHWLNWTKTWATLYAMPCSKNCGQLMTTKSRTKFDSRFLKNYRFFNTLVLTGYLLPWLVAGPFFYIAQDCVRRNMKQHAELVTIIDKLRSSDASISQSQVSSERIKIFSLIQDLQENGERANNHGKRGTTAVVTLHILGLVLFIWATQSIIRALFSQIKLYQRCIQNKRLVLTLERSSVDFEVREMKKASTGLALPAGYGSEIIEIKPPLTIQPGCHKKEFVDVANLNLIDWKSWLPSFKRGTEVDANLWKSNLIRGFENDDESESLSQLESRCLALRRYAANTLWQAILIFLISLSYVSLAAILVFNFLHVPTKVSYPDSFIIHLKLAGLIWSLGGTLLAGLSAVVSCSGESLSNKIDLAQASETKTHSKNYEMDGHKIP